MGDQEFDILLPQAENCESAQQEVGNHRHLAMGRTSCAGTRHFYPKALVLIVLPGGSCSSPSPSCVPVSTDAGERVGEKPSYFAISDGFSGILAAGRLWQGVFRHRSWSRPDGVQRRSHRCRGSSSHRSVVGPASCTSSLARHPSDTIQLLL
jgi:hypothetical protein